MEGFEDRFSDRARGYAAHRPRYPPRLAELLATLAPARGLAWDAGCGSGQLSRLLAGRFEHVVATDASAAQLRQRRAHSGIGWVRARAEAAPLRAGVADLTVAAQAAHWFDLPAYWAEVRRVATGGALVAILCYGRHATGHEGVDAALRRFHDETLAPFWPARRRHVVDGYRSLSFPFPEIRAPRMEMTAEWSFAEHLAYVETWSAVGRMRDAGDEGLLGRFRDELAAAWGDPRRRRTVRWPLTLRLGRAGPEKRH